MATRTTKSKSKNSRSKKKNTKNTQVTVCNGIENGNCELQNEQIVNCSQDDKLKIVDNSTKNQTKKPKEKQLNNHLITDYFPSLSRRRLTAKQLELQQDKLIKHYLVNQTDPKDLFIVDDIQDKGKGVIASKFISKGSFICEYSGDLIDMKEAQLKESEYESKGAGCYMYYFSWSNKSWCVDATKPTGRIGRLINHSRKSPNCKTKLFILNEKPHLIFIALKDINPNEEILYDYGERDKFALEAHPWLKTT